jgi:hypothetical protein
VQIWVIYLGEVSGCLACGIFVILHIFRVSASGIVEKDFKVGINLLTYDSLHV